MASHSGSPLKRPGDTASNEGAEIVVVELVPAVAEVGDVLGELQVDLGASA